MGIEDGPRLSSTLRACSACNRQSQAVIQDTCNSAESTWEAHATFAELAGSCMSWHCDGAQAR